MMLFSRARIALADVYHVAGYAYAYIMICYALMYRYVLGMHMWSKLLWKIGLFSLTNVAIKNLFDYTTGVLFLCVVTVIHQLG